MKVPRFRNSLKRRVSTVVFSIPIFHFAILKFIGTLLVVPAILKWFTFESPNDN